MAGQEGYPGNDAWRRIERLLPTLDELPQVPQDPDTELHWMSGPSQPTPEWVIKSWNKAASDRRAREARMQPPLLDSSAL